MPDLTKWMLDEVIEDFVKKPLEITIEGLSDKFVIKGTFQSFRKKKEKKK